MATRCTKCNLELPNGPLVFCPDCYTKVPPRPEEEVERGTLMRTVIGYIIAVVIGLFLHLITIASLGFPIGTILSLLIFIACIKIIPSKVQRWGKVPLVCQRCGSESWNKFCSDCGQYREDRNI